ncbi:unnamed protein product, partial [Ilex paraguariensis]
MASPRYSVLFFLLSIIVSLARSEDAQALLELKALVDPSNSLQWQGIDMGKRQGIKECQQGRVTKKKCQPSNISSTTATTPWL